MTKEEQEAEKHTRLQWERLFRNAQEALAKVIARRQDRLLSTVPYRNLVSPSQHD
jgi:hypothetical protein